MFGVLVWVGVVFGVEEVMVCVVGLVICGFNDLNVLFEGFWSEYKMGVYFFFGDGLVCMVWDSIVLEIYQVVVICVGGEVVLFEDQVVLLENMVGQLEDKVVYYKELVIFVVL